MNLRTGKHNSVCFFGFDERDEGGRAWAVRTGLVENGVRVERCQTNVSGFFAKCRDLYRKWQHIGEIDAIYVIFMGYYLMPLAWYLAWRRGVPVILDVLVSQYDTEVADRERVSGWSPRAWLLWIVDFMSCQIADAIVVDTNEHKKFFVHTFHVDPKKVLILRVGCRSDLFIPALSSEQKNEFIVEFHGGISRLQGVEYILDAAKVLQDKNERVRFEITGIGQLTPEITARANELQLNNVVFLGRSSLYDLPVAISRGDICLGIFGKTNKALRVIPNKVYECLSCGKPVITERSPAALEVLHDREEVLFVEPGSGADLADKILELKNDAPLREKLGTRAREVSLGIFSPRMIVAPLIQWLESRP